jgi:hypothetical protein
MVNQHEAGTTWTMNPSEGATSGFEALEGGELAQDLDAGSPRALAGAWLGQYFVSSHLSAAGRLQGWEPKRLHASAAEGSHADRCWALALVYPRYVLTMSLAL